MFIHLGGEVMVLASDVIAILDTKHTSQTEATREFIDHIKHQGHVVMVDEQECKSYVVTDNILYISPISSVTLKKRAEIVQTAEDSPFIP